MVSNCALPSHPLSLLNWLGEGKALRVPHFISFQELAAVSYASHSSNKVSQLCRISKGLTHLPARELGIHLNPYHGILP